MAQVVGRYNDDKESNEVKKTLIKVGRDAQNFLQQHTQTIAPGAAEQLQTCLTAIEMGDRT